MTQHNLTPEHAAILNQATAAAGHPSTFVWSKKDTMRAARELARIELFWTQFDRTKVKVSEELGFCWIWTGTVGSKGYGTFRMNGQMQYIHRIAFQLVKGPIPRGRKACHRCDVRLCGNPNHVYNGTSTSNLVDAYTRQRRPQGEAHPRAILTDKDVREIRRSKLAQKHLAVMFKVSQPTISNIKRGKAWSHVK